MNNSSGFHLSENVFTSLPLLKDILAVYIIICWKQFTFSALNIWFHCPLAFIVFFEGNIAFFFL